MQQAFLTVDLGFGDAGKGSIVDFLTRSTGAHTVVRYNGGAQAGHRVVTASPTPQEHVFAQFGSGTLAGAATHLSRFMLLEPLAMMAEEQHLRTLGITDAFHRTTIDREALVITPFQRAANRLKELTRGAGRHGSCGIGIGETMADALARPQNRLFAADLTRPDILHAKLEATRVVNLAKVQLRGSLPDHDQVEAELDVLTAPDWIDWLMNAYRDFAIQAQIVPGGQLHAILAQDGAVIFEGAQGVLLDEWLGFHPHTTWSTTTLENADRLLAEAGYRGEIHRIGITRAYATRHGAGPLVTEDALLTQALPDAANSFGAWQQGFRIGWLDLPMLRYACAAVGHLDSLAVTCVDRLAALPSLKICTRYLYKGSAVERLAPSPTAHDLAYQERLTHTLAHCRPVYEPLSDPQALLHMLGKSLAIPVGIVSTGPTAHDKQTGVSQHSGVALTD